MHISVDLSGVLALVTGASGSLGQHFARTLAAAGAQVVISGRRLDRLQVLAEEIGNSGGTALPCKLDVTSEDSIVAALDQVEGVLGTVTLVVNNSGIASSGKAVELGVSAWDQTLNTNLRGAWLVARETARRMIKADKGGSIINISSILAERVQVAVAAYSASKAGLNQLTRSLALEWARHGIRVNAIAPGYIETDLNREFFQTAAGQTMIERIPQRRLGQVTDLEGPLLLLASDSGRYLTGTILTVDGGHQVSPL